MCTPPTIPSLPCPSLHQGPRSQFLQSPQRIFLNPTFVLSSKWIEILDLQYLCRKMQEVQRFQ